jgi:PAS domain-containing protein
MQKPEQPDFKSLFESIPGLYLILLPDFTIIGASDDYLSATLTKRSEIFGRALFDVFPDNPDDAQATGVSNLRESLNRVLKNREADTMALQRYDIRKPDGTFEKRYWSSVNKPVFNSSGELVYIIHRVEDVTQIELLKKEKEEIMRQLHIELERKIVAGTEEIVKSEKRFRTLIENNFDAILLNDENGIPIFQSPSAERMLGWTLEEKNSWANFLLFIPMMLNS